MLPNRISADGTILPQAGPASLSPGRCAVLAEIFQASIEELTGEDYSEAQQAAWASRADDGGLRRAPAEALTLVATIDGSPVGFVALKGNDADRHALRASGGGRAGRRHAAVRGARKARHGARRARG